MNANEVRRRQQSDKLVELKSRLRGKNPKKKKGLKNNYPLQFLLAKLLSVSIRRVHHLTSFGRLHLCPPLSLANSIPSKSFLFFFFFSNWYCSCSSSSRYEKYRGGHQNFGRQRERAKASIQARSLPPNFASI